MNAARRPNVVYMRLMQPDAGDAALDAAQRAHDGPAALMTLSGAFPTIPVQEG